MVTVPNINNIYNARYGYYKGKRYTFTHRDPATGDLWGEDIPVGKNPVEYGAWVPGDSVKLIWDDGATAKVVEKPSKPKNKYNTNKKNIFRPNNTNKNQSNNQNNNRRKPRNREYREHKE